MSVFFKGTPLFGGLETEIKEQPPFAWGVPWKRHTFMLDSKCHLQEAKLLVAPQPPHAQKGEQTGTRLAWCCREKSCKKPGISTSERASRKKKKLICTFPQAGLQGPLSFPLNCARTPRWPNCLPAAKSSRAIFGPCHFSNACCASGFETFRPPTLAQVNVARKPTPRKHGRHGSLRPASSVFNAASAWSGITELKKSYSRLIPLRTVSTHCCGSETRA